MGWGKKVGIGCASVLGVVGILVVIVFFVVKSLTAEPEQVVHQFVTAAAAGDYAAAHACFSMPLKERQSLDAFTTDVKGAPSLFAIADISFNERSLDTSGAKFAGTVTLKAGTKVPASFSLVQEKGVWKILAYHIGSTD